jgi:AmmeMemoRadiSam system protein B
MKYPLLRRDIQPVPFTAGQRRMLSFNDPLRLIQAGLALDMRAVPFLRLLDGTRDLAGIQAELMKDGGAVIPIPEIEALIRVLDESLLLESEGFFSLRQAVRDEFERAFVREALLAGSSYPLSAEELASSFDVAEAGLSPLPFSAASKPVRGILAPHIDITVARDAYVRAYRLLKGRVYERVIILGINHQGHGGLWSVTDKSYATPFGPLHADREAVAALRGSLPRGALAPHDYDHKHEHSVEFQAVLLGHYLKAPTKIVPILCGGIHEFILEGRSPFEDERFLAMKEALSALLNEGEGRTLLVAGVDFSHVGPKFGHGDPSRALLDRAAAYDGKIIEALLSGRPEDIFAHAAAQGDYCNVCGLPSMLLFSWLLGPCEAELLDRGVYDEKATSSAVTYAAMAFYGDA